MLLGLTQSVQTSPLYQKHRNIALLTDLLRSKSPPPKAFVSLALETRLQVLLGLCLFRLSPFIFLLNKKKLYSEVWKGPTIAGVTWIVFKVVQLFRLSLLVVGNLLCLVMLWLISARRDKVCPLYRVRNWNTKDAVHTPKKLYQHVKNSPTISLISFLRGFGQVILHSCCL